MPKPSIKWGILGTSPISETIATAIHESEIGTLVAVGSRSLEKAKQFATTFSIPTYYDNYQALLDNQDIDVVYIGLPNHLHKEWIIRCANANKHILCEKPLVISIEEAHEVIATTEKTKVFCMEALMYRCHPFTKKLHELIQSKIIGDVKLYNATYTANIADVANPTAGGSIRNLGCYPVSLVRLLANAEPNEIIGMGKMNPNNQTDNQASAILKFADNAIAVISTADNIAMFWQFDIYGTMGHLKVVSNPWLPRCDDNKIVIYLNNEIFSTEINVNASKSLYAYQIDTVNQQICNRDSDQGISLLDSLGNIIVLESWLQQVKNMSKISDLTKII